MALDVTSRAAVEEAANFGLRVEAHAHDAEGIKNALRAGVASIEHATLIDDEGIALAKQRGYTEPDLPRGSQPPLGETRDQWIERLRRRISAGFATSETKIDGVSPVTGRMSARFEASRSASARAR